MTDAITKTTLLGPAPAAGEHRHRFLPAMNEVFDPAPATVARVILSLDLGEISAAHAGVHVPFFEVDPSVAELHFQRLGDGRYRIEEACGFDTLDACFEALDAELEDPFAGWADTIEQEHGLAPGSDIALQPIDRATKPWWKKPFALTLSEEVEWLQGRSRAYHGVDDPAWLYCGHLDSHYLFGRLFVFYNTLSGRVIQLCEHT